MYNLCTIDIHLRFRISNLEFQIYEDIGFELRK